MSAAEYIIPGTTVHDLLDEIWEIAESRADAEIGSDGIPRGNAWMDVQVKVEQAIELLKRAERDFKNIKATVGEAMRTLDHATAITDHRQEGT